MRALEHTRRWWLASRCAGRRKEGMWTQPGENAAVQALSSPLNRLSETGTGRKPRPVPQKASQQKALVRYDTRAHSVRYMREGVAHQLPPLVRRLACTGRGGELAPGSRTPLTSSVLATTAAAAAAAAAGCGMSGFSAAGFPLLVLIPKQLGVTGMP